MPVAQAAPALKPKLSVDGAPISGDLQDRLTELVLDDSISLPDMLDLTFADTNSGFFEASPFKIGAKVKVDLSAPGQPPSIFEGECVSIGARYHTGKFQATVRAFDLSHRLNRGRITKTFESMTASDIFTRIIGEHGLTKGTVENTTVTFPFLSVVNETPFAFVHRLAAEHGLEAVMADNKMHLRKPGSTDPPTTLTLGGVILSLDVEVSAADQVKEIVVAGWDPKQKKAVPGQATVATKAAKIELTPVALSTKMGATKKLVIGARPVETQAHATAIAKATAEQAGSSFIDVRGTASGQTGLRAGKKINLQGCGKFVNGEYTLSSTRHTWNEYVGYVTEFTVSGQQDRSLGGLMAGSGAGAASANRSMGGVVTAIVTDNKDPENIGRVKVALPWLDAEHVSGWARVAYPGGGPNRGITFLPEVNDEVAVAFHHGDPGQPVVIGGLYNGKDKFPDHQGAGHTDRGKTAFRGLYSDKHHLAFADKTGQESITLGLRDKSYVITLDKKGTVVSIGSDGKVDIKAKQGVTITAASGNIVLDAKAGDVKIGGVNVTVEGKAGLTLSATGTAKLKGATVAIG